MAVPSMTNNSPIAGSIAWGAFTIKYMGVEYAVSAGNTAQRWTWWRYNGGSSIIEAGADVPADLTDDDLVLFGNKAGIGVRVQSATLIDGELLVDGSVLASAIAADAITGKIVTGGLFRTSATGTRLEIDAVDRTSILAFGGDPAETAPAIIDMAEDGSDIRIRTAAIGHGTAQIYMRTGPSVRYNATAGTVIFIESNEGAVGPIHWYNYAAEPNVDIDYNTKFWGAIDAPKKLQNGYFASVNHAASTGTTSGSVVFPGGAMRSAPSVALTPSAVRLSCAVTSVSTTGFNWTLTNFTSAVSGTGVIYWQAQC